MTARRTLLNGLAHDVDIFELVSELVPLHPRDNTSPARCSSASLRTRWIGAGPAGPTPCPWRDYASGSCPSAPSAARQNKKFQYAVLAAAALHGGTDPDLLDEVAWWQSDDFWQYALFAAVAYVRAAASRAGVPLSQACQDLAQRSGDPAP